MGDGEAFLRAVRDLDRALDENLERTRLMKARIGQIERDHAAGKSVRDIVEVESSPLLVRLLSESARALDDAGARVRRTEALALHNEGMTMDQIAGKFGVTRQRVSGLLRDARSAAGSHKDG